MKRACLFLLKKKSISMNVNHPILFCFAEIMLSSFFLYSFLSYLKYKDLLFEKKCHVDESDLKSSVVTFLLYKWKKYHYYLRF